MYLLHVIVRVLAKVCVYVCGVGMEVEDFVGVGGKGFEYRLASQTSEAVVTKKGGF